MKPILLKMTAFGPYKNEEVIDFTKLQERKLFVISGQTGAGKTTIFDAICFALYGFGSGQDRKDTKMLRSDFAEHRPIQIFTQVVQRSRRQDHVSLQLVDHLNEVESYIDMRLIDTIDDVIHSIEETRQSLE